MALKGECRDLTLFTVRPGQVDKIHEFVCREIENHHVVAHVQMTIMVDPVRLYRGAKLIKGCGDGH